MIDNRSAEINTRNLTQLLTHLDRNIAKSTELDYVDNKEIAARQKSRAVALSSFERQKLRGNFEHARALLLRLEHDSTSITIASRKRAVQADLRAKREQIKRLQVRIQELDDASESDSDDDEEDADASLEPEQPIEHGAPVSSDADFSTTADGANVMRQRLGSPTAAGTTAYSTGIHSTTNSAKHEDDQVASREKTLTTDRNEQEQIMDSLLSLTRQLKTSASVFQGSLENEKSLLDKASSGLDKNVDGMDAAGKRMGTLRKMTEGKGFFARLKLYGFIAILWLVALIMVFVLPKLRF